MPRMKAISLSGFYVHANRNVKYIDVSMNDLN